MSRKKLAWANKEVETFVCILGEEDVVYDVYVAAAAIDIRPTTKGTVGGGNATSELSWAIPPPPYRTEANRTVPHPAVETQHNPVSAFSLLVPVLAAVYRFATGHRRHATTLHTKTCCSATLSMSAGGDTVFPE